MADVIRAIELAASAMESDETAVREWIITVPIACFGNRTAMEMVADGEGNRVIELLYEIADIDREESRSTPLQVPEPQLVSAGA